MNHGNFVQFKLNDFSEYWYNLSAIKQIKITRVGNSCRVELDNDLELKGDAAIHFVKQLEEIRYE